MPSTIAHRQVVLEQRQASSREGVVVVGGINRPFVVAHDPGAIAVVAEAVAKDDQPVVLAVGHGMGQGGCKRGCAERIEQASIQLHLAFFCTRDYN